MNTVFGELIRKEWRNSGIPQKEFAKMLSMSLRNAQNLFERDDFSITQLMEISKVLKKDFVGLYLLEKKYPLQDIPGDSPQSFSDQIEEYIKTKKEEPNQVNVQINLKGDLNTISKHFADLLLKIKKEAEEYGITIA